ncbi:MAG TPA: HGxxPAAW family protein [Streptosporangiaceae bacterium]|nr:HGxxPAAW family protein [Streptosporangiaceae bacterium]
MAEQPGPGTLASASEAAVGSDREASPVEHAAALVHESFHGRTVSWIAVVVICVGFVVGGIGMVPTPTWWLFWTGAGITLAGIAVGAAAKITEDWY